MKITREQFDAAMNAREVFEVCGLQPEESLNSDGKLAKSIYQDALAVIASYLRDALGHKIEVGDQVRFPNFKDMYVVHEFVHDTRCRLLNDPLTFTLCKVSELELVSKGTK